MWKRMPWQMKKANERNGGDKEKKIQSFIFRSRQLTSLITLK